MEKTSYERARFTPHITAEAVTRPKGKFAVQRAVGANLKTHALFSSTTYAVLNRIEIGTILTYYFLENHRYNFNIKYNFYRGKEFFWSLGYSLTNYKVETVDDGSSTSTYEGVDLEFMALQFLFNYIPQHSRFKFAANLNILDAILHNWDGTDRKMLLGLTSELGVDISYSFDEPYDLTFGFGWLREAGMSALEERAFGFGASVRWYRPEKLFSSPTIGVHYTPQNGQIEPLFSTTFY
ncbi:MAG: hypothetical protein M9899_10790 [Bdellovibrionaceae bacterium]|nr:hypothetical protein [Pseudobdellovibrionaceae bacterium]